VSTDNNWGIFRVLHELTKSSKRKNKIMMKITNQCSTTGAITTQKSNSLGGAGFGGEGKV